jgi:hypothetical protein
MPTNGRTGQERPLAEEAGLRLFAALTLAAAPSISPHSLTDSTNFLTLGSNFSRAAKSGENQPNTISAMEKRGAETLTSGLDTVRAIMVALDAAGVELTNHGQPGCRLKAR